MTETSRKTLIRSNSPTLRVKDLPFAKDTKPLPVSSYKFLETELIFDRMIENREVIKNLLVNKYHKLLGE